MRTKLICTLGLLAAAAFAVKSVVIPAWIRDRETEGRYPDAAVRTAVPDAPVFGAQAARGHTDEFLPDQVVAEQPPITDVTFVTADQAGAQVRDDDLVIGVVLDGQARAYPVNMMSGSHREIFNDELAGHSIAATW